MPELDKFYTKPEIAKYCIDIFKQYSKGIIIEPSAGNGAFSSQIDCLAYDIKPEANDIKEQDFFTLDLPSQEFSIIGNPPFGKRSKLAIEFFNYAAKSNAEVIGFILPITFQKWSVQKQLDNNYSLVESIKLIPDAFLLNNKSYSVRCVFQIWVKQPNIFNNIRLFKAPSLTHPDFKLYQYNCTPQAEKYFNEDWDFAVYRQGRKDYTERFYPNQKEIMSRNIQYMFFKAKDNETLTKLKALDFTELSEWNMSTPGFGKADLVMFYNQTYS